MFYGWVYIRFTILFHKAQFSSYKPVFLHSHTDLGGKIVLGLAFTGLSLEVLPSWLTALRQSSGCSRATVNYSCATWKEIEVELWISHLDQGIIKLLQLLFPVSCLFLILFTTYCQNCVYTNEKVPFIVLLYLCLRACVAMPNHYLVWGERTWRDLASACLTVCVCLSEEDHCGLK